MYIPLFNDYGDMNVRSIPFGEHYLLMMEFHLIHHKTLSATFIFNSSICAEFVSILI